MMESGYTLAEMMIALVIVSGTAAAMTEGVHTFTRFQGDVGAELNRSRAMADAQRGFAAFLRNEGPFRTDGQGRAFRGDGDSFEFACGSRSECRATIEPDARGTSLQLDTGDAQFRYLLPGAHDVRFSFTDGDAERATWPPRADGAQLSSVALMSDSGPLLVANPGLDQAAACEFDPVIKACRDRGDGGG